MMKNGVFTYDEAAFKDTFKHGRRLYGICPGYTVKTIDAEATFGDKAFYNRNVLFTCMLLCRLEDMGIAEAIFDIYDCYDGNERLEELHRRMLYLKCQERDASALCKVARLSRDDATGDKLARECDNALRAFEVGVLALLAMGASEYKVRRQFDRFIAGTEAVQALLDAGVDLQDVRLSIISAELDAVREDVTLHHYETEMQQRIIEKHKAKRS